VGLERSLEIQACDVFSIFVPIAGIQAIILLESVKEIANGAQKDDFG
jgi:hypothetical protein